MPRMKHLSKKSKSSPYKKVSTLDSFGFTSANEKTSGASSEEKAVYKDHTSSNSEGFHKSPGKSLNAANDAEPQKEKLNKSKHLETLRKHKTDDKTLDTEVRNTTAKKKGRPPAADNVSSEASSLQTEPPKEVACEVTSPVKKRGRPRKSDASPALYIVEAENKTCQQNSAESEIGSLQRVVDLPSLAIKQEMLTEHNESAEMTPTSHQNNAKSLKHSSKKNAEGSSASNQIDY
ncbi:hypothetical protein EB796_022184 [Bugula neritina]|uniref:Uncharacterized protein n=1 Tax=Bugula neritina TaxID=10212 RepID=A0A7J7J093_BUGNE|nr:hypothetical protein EB796_022184 [Bugula neritina]